MTTQSHIIINGSHDLRESPRIGLSKVLLLTGMFIGHSDNSKHSSRISQWLSCDLLRSLSTQNHKEGQAQYRCTLPVASSLARRFSRLTVAFRIQSSGWPCQVATAPPTSTESPMKTKGNGIASKRALQQPDQQKSASRAGSRMLEQIQQFSLTYLEHCNRAHASDT